VYSNLDGSMTTHIGTLSTEIELTPDPPPWPARAPSSDALDEPGRLQRRLRRERSIAARTRAEGFDD
jgi:hypothetical protein